jgi:hypothetical protein
MYTRIARGFLYFPAFYQHYLMLCVMGAASAFMEIRAALSPAITRSKGRNSPPDAIITSRNLVGKCRKRIPFVISTNTVVKWLLPTGTVLRELIITGHISRSFR